jgi:hypothetical protein
MRQGRTHTAPKVNYTRAYKRESTALIYIRAIFGAYFQLPVFYTSNVAPNKAGIEMRIQHTREKHLNT